VGFLNLFFAKKVYFLNRRVRITLTFFFKCYLGQLMDTMRTMFNVSAETEVKLLGSFSHNLYDELTDATKTVSDYNIISNQYIILVEKENGAWPSNSSVRKPVSASKSADAITNTGWVSNIMDSNKCPITVVMVRMKCIVVHRYCVSICDVFPRQHELRMNDEGQPVTLSPELEVL